MGMKKGDNRPQRFYILRMAENDDEDERPRGLAIPPDA